MNSTPRIVIFTSPTCSWCKRAMQFLRERRFRFKEIDVSKSPSSIAELQRVSGQTGVPVLLINNHPVVGFDVAKIKRLLNIR